MKSFIVGMGAILTWLSIMFFVPGGVFNHDNPPQISQAETCQKLHAGYVMTFTEDGGYDDEYKILRGKTCTIPWQTPEFQSQLMLYTTKGTVDYAGVNYLYSTKFMTFRNGKVYFSK